MAIHVCMLMLGLIWCGIEASAEKAEQQEAPSIPNLQNALAKLSLTLPSFPISNEVSLEIPSTSRQETPITLSDLLHNTPRTPPSSGWRNDFPLSIRNNTNFKIGVHVTSECLATICVEEKPGISGTLQREMVLDTGEQLLHSKQGHIFVLPEYEKLFGSAHVDAISYRYLKSYIHLKAVESADRKNFGPIKVPLKNIIKAGDYYSVRVGKNNKLTVYKINHKKDSSSETL